MLFFFFLFIVICEKNATIYIASCVRCDWQFALLKFICHLLEFAFADSNIVFLIFFSHMNLELFSKVWLKSGHTGTPVAVGQPHGRQDRTSSSPGRLSSAIAQLLDLLTTQHIPLLLPFLASPVLGVRRARGPM